MGRKSLIIIALLIGATLNTTAQTGTSSFEFAENKGQWDNRIKFKGDLPAGAFFLEQKGFTVLLHHPQDYLRLVENYHNHGSNKAPKKVEAKPGASPNAAVEEDNPGLKEHEGETIVVRSHAYKVQFIGANESAQIFPDKPLDTYNNYLLGSDPSKWASNVKIYQALLYKNVYPNIDVRYYSENGTLKYDIIVNPGGEVNNIALKYEGVEKLRIKNNELIVKTSVGDVKELYPYSFQFDKATGKKEIACNYEITGNNTVKFNIKNYSRNAILVIDPSLIFSTFTGSTADNYGFTATPGPDGSFYAGGIVFAQGYPTTPGAFQTIFRGGAARPTDIGITKFNPSGTQRVYSTYVGGRENEFPHSLFCDPQGNLVIMGRSYSTDYPTKPQNNTVGPASGNIGGANIIVTKLNASGTGLIGSMIIGGTGDDGVNVEDQLRVTSNRPLSILQNYGDDSRSEVILDRSNNIYVAAQTKSSNFPMKGNGFQTSFGGGGQDGVVLKIAPNCDSVIWSSYLGGNADDGAFVLALEPSTQNIYVAGATSSANFPGPTAGAKQTSNAGGIDGYITIISNDGSSQIKTTYLGTGSTDMIYGIQFDKRGFPYVMGTTRGSWEVVNAAFRQGNSKQFVAKLQPDLSAYVYSTVFGSGASRPNMSPVAFLVDRCENVYISGWGGSLNANSTDAYDLAGVAGMRVTSDAIKSTTDNRDFYFIVIRKDAASQLYGTFFGQTGGQIGEHVDGGTSRFDQEGVIFQSICANCLGGAVFPTTIDAVARTNGTGDKGCNLAAVKIAFNFAGVGSGPKAYFNNIADTVGCVPFTVDFRDTILNAQRYEWSFGDGTPDVVTSTYDVTHTFSAVGTYRVRLIAVDSTTCNIRDTAYTTIRVKDDKAGLAFTARKLPPCQSLQYQFDNLSTFPAGKPFGALSFTWDFGDGTILNSGSGSITHSYKNPGTYIVKLTLTDTNYCNAPETDTLTLRINENVVARFNTPLTGCAPHTAYFDNQTLAGHDFFWDFGDGTTSTQVNPTHVYANTGTYTIKMIAFDSTTCNKIDSTSQTITVNVRPTADFSFAPIPPQVNKPTIFTNLSTGGVRYKWLFGDDDSTITTSLNNVSHQYNSTDSFRVYLITYNQFNCTDTAWHVVHAIVHPLLDVPNAFTPGRFGRNSIINVEGFGIARMTFTIYNRWGQKVFETNNRKLGWDGTYKGVLQPMDVYAYTLDVEFFDNTKVRKTGDITLIR